MEQIPDTIGDGETIVGIIFSPMNVKFLQNGSTQILPNAFRSPSGIDEVSVIRFDYSNVDFCKNHGMTNQKSNQKRLYFGLATLHAHQIKTVNAEVISTPKNRNPAHADIKIGFVPQKGEPLPPEYKMKIDKMAEMAILYEDPNPISRKWEGSVLKKNF